MALKKGERIFAPLVLKTIRTRGACSVNRLQRLLNRNKRQIQQAIAELKSQDAIYVCDWERTSEWGDLSRVYAIKTSYYQHDCAKPPPLTNTEKCSRYQQNRKRKAQFKCLQSWIPLSSPNQLSQNDTQ